jgi:ketosteroid isomerase-like protein
MGQRAVMTNLIETVQSIYGAFGRGDVATILGHIADDVDWEYGVIAHEVPWLQHRTGHPGVGAFFEAVGRELEFKRFAVNAVLGSERLVVALIDLECVVRRTGATLVERDEAHIWHFDAAGKVARFRHAADTAQHARAWAQERQRS